MRAASDPFSYFKHYSIIQNLVRAAFSGLHSSSQFYNGSVVIAFWHCIQ